MRPAGFADLKSLAKLEAESFPAPWSLAQLEAELGHAEALVLVAHTLAGALVGYAAFRFGPGEVELLRLAVAPESRRRKLASALVAAGLQQARERGAEICCLEVRADNLGAVAFYERLGFEVSGRRRAYFPDGRDALLMQRRSQI